ncbi:hydrogenase expression/formation protein HypE [Candidatus Omnitrophus magneticus]|uniref:Hydrogenase expression/formation protein HypE n=1 Tax=Candidatus Omnitrophus magneticus TaxID=1609969 RepID=A0A0F0CNV7_9BACT|nr:hydrogenase expression/formation protein HypE [Candidatus Omnitrophus magneticus]
MNTITLSHGSGGKASNELIKNLFFKYFSNEILNTAMDSGVFNLRDGFFAFTTDSFVVKPLFFNGGDIGKLAVCGTVNDLAVSGASPKYLTCAFIIEEGFSLDELEAIVKSMAYWADKAGVKIISGDTKVVGKGESDGVFINTSGIGEIIKGVSLGIDKINIGDKVIVTGTMGDHGFSILSKRKGLTFETTLASDSAPLNKMLENVLKNVKGVKFMRDPTRGGLASTLNEVVTDKSGILIKEEKIPISDSVRGISELLGMDPLYMANEGKAVIIASSDTAPKIVELLRENEYGKNACIVGEVTANYKNKVCIETIIGTVRILDMPQGEIVPRIC